MKKIITALANPELNKELKKIEEFEIMADDIQYQEGVLEILEQKNVDILILSELLKGENQLKEFLQKIKQKNNTIKIILLLEKENAEKIKIAQEEKVQTILFHHKVSVQEMISILKNISMETNLEEEIRNIKKLILENNYQKVRQKTIFEKIKEKIEEKISNKISNPQTEAKNNVKIITIAGGHGTGKSLIASCLALQCKTEKRKTLLMDFDLLNQSIHTIFGKKKIPQKLEKKKKQYSEYMPKDYQELKIKINSYLDIICGSNFIFPREKMNIQHLQDVMEKIKKEYDVILIDISSECFLEYTKFLLQKTDSILFLTEGNLIEIKKAIHLLEIYTQEWNIEKKKINIVINKYHKNTIDFKLLQHIFMEYSVLGKISFNKNYDIWINKNMKQFFPVRKEKREHKAIMQMLLEEKQKHTIRKPIRGRLVWKH